MEDDEMVQGVDFFSLHIFKLFPKLPARDDIKVMMIKRGRW